MKKKKKNAREDIRREKRDPKEALNDKSPIRTEAGARAPLSWVSAKNKTDFSIEAVTASIK